MRQDPELLFLVGGLGIGFVGHDWFRSSQIYGRGDVGEFQESAAQIALYTDNSEMTPRWAMDPGWGWEQISLLRHRDENSGKKRGRTPMLISSGKALGAVAIDHKTSQGAHAGGSEICMGLDGCYGEEMKISYRIWWYTTLTLAQWAFLHATST